MAASIAASEVQGEAIGSLFSLFTKFGIKDENDALKAMDTLNLLGKEGAYELKTSPEKATRAMVAVFRRGRTWCAGCQGRRGCT